MKTIERLLKSVKNLKRPGESKALQISLKMTAGLSLPPPALGAGAYTYIYLYIYIYICIHIYIYIYMRELCPMWRHAAVNDASRYLAFMVGPGLLD